MWFREVEEGIRVLTTEGSLMFWGFRLHAILILPKSVWTGNQADTDPCCQSAGRNGFLRKKCSLLSAILRMRKRVDDFGNKSLVSLNNEQGISESQGLGETLLWEGTRTEQVRLRA